MQLAKGKRGGRTVSVTEGAGGRVGKFGRDRMKDVPTSAGDVGRQMDVRDGAISWLHA